MTTLEARAWLAALFISGCTCGRVSTEGDAGEDGTEGLEAADEVAEDGNGDPDAELSEGEVWEWEVLDMHLRDFEHTDCGEPEGWEPRVFIPPGTFYMGAPYFEDEDPFSCWSDWQCFLRDGGCYTSFIESGCVAHEVFLEGYWIDRYEVSIGEYYEYVQVEEGVGVPPRVCDNVHPCSESSCENPDYPIESLTGWGDDGRPLPFEFLERDVNEFPMNCLTRAEAEAFCRWRGGRLPTEAQWERAAKDLVPDMRYYTTGDHVLYGGSECDEECYIIHMAWSASQSERVSMGSFFLTRSSDSSPDRLDPSPSCILNLSYNISEWMAGDFEPYPGTYFEDRWAWSPGSCRVRGWAWCDPAEYPIWHRCLRYAIPPDARSSCVGFRCVYDAP